MLYWRNMYLYKIVTHKFILIIQIDRVKVNVVESKCQEIMITKDIETDQIVRVEIKQRIMQCRVRMGFDN